MARRRHVAPIRSDRSLARRRGKQPTRPLVLIVCEGGTEKEYFEALRNDFRLSTAEVVIPKNTAGSAPINVVEFAERKCQEDGGYDYAFCVFDRNGHASFEEARRRITECSTRVRRPLPLREAVSIPCFEIWILLHFQNTDRPFENCNAVIGHIEGNNYIADYSKADPKLFKLIKDRLERAVENARWLEGKAVENNYNPYTSVHKLVEILIELKTLKR